MPYSITNFSKVQCEEKIGTKVYSFSMRKAIRDALVTQGGGFEPDLLNTPANGDNTVVRIPMKPGDHPSRVTLYGFTEVGTTEDIRRSKKCPVKGAPAAGALNPVLTIDGVVWEVGGYQGAKIRRSPGTLTNQA